MSEKHRTSFYLAGRFVGFANFEGGRPRRLILDSEGRQWCLKISKRLMLPYGTTFIPGMNIEVQGAQKWDRDEGCIKRKVEAMRIVGPAAQPQESEASVQVIQLCSKANCWKNGGSELYHRLRAEINKQDLQNQVQVETTGCLGNCKRCPSLLCLPQAKIYGQLSPDEIPELLQEACRDDVACKV